VWCPFEILAILAAVRAEQPDAKAGAREGDDQLSGSGIEGVIPDP